MYRGILADLNYCLFLENVLIISIAGRSADWLAHLPWEQGVGGSNPLAPTTNEKTLQTMCPFLKARVLKTFL